MEGKDSEEKQSSTNKQAHLLYRAQAKQTALSGLGAAPRPQTDGPRRARGQPSGAPGHADRSHFAPGGPDFTGSHGPCWFPASDVKRGAFARPRPPLTPLLLTRVTGLSHWRRPPHPPPLPEGAGQRDLTPGSHPEELLRFLLLVFGFPPGICGKSPPTWSRAGADDAYRNLSPAISA
ncbi:hypothetical protein SKAU_G00399180 [Synaphobranchus kaupii]|uniref:Uncharacterized protein n=1 Tax=Synaphobranchus kaupii TaxID=118154 RepID=A0A9Q1E8P8_SYNKA|nr:hypothetical protein SKAU_G00399180 [Synaphobranchus kaupii]